MLLQNGSRKIATRGAKTTRIMMLTQLVKLLPIIAHNSNIWQLNQCEIGALRTQLAPKLEK